VALLGLEIRARNEQSHAERKQKGDAEVGDMRLLNMQLVADKDFEHYMRPGVPLSAKKRVTT
jgi:hypothetical protein